MSFQLVTVRSTTLQSGGDPYDALSVYVMFRNRALQLVALLRKMTCNLRRPMGLCHPLSRKAWRIMALPLLHAPHERETDSTTSNRILLTHTYTHTHMHTHTYTHAHIHTRTHTHATRNYTRMRVHTPHTCTHTEKHTRYTLHIHRHAESHV